jgi:lipopolysaccharide transport system ATP-binding protein
MDIVIKVEQVSKKYLISHKEEARYALFRDELLNGVKSIFKRNSSATHEDFLALNEVSFEIKQGQRVGIIGRNGAGKSTLLKILSRIVEPTKGRITIDGRVASLLEVGTGFHPELSGRENIYLNGSILGMNRAEISRKFDAIVAFAEVEKFLDTPVKRYSSGMYVRLAFSVAAHLEPEIMIVDEVLAVGDAAFQKKCLGKMEDVSTNEGRTVLFVSHNMGQISSLCTEGILLDKGNLVMRDTIKKVIQSYYDGDKKNATTEEVFNDSLTKEIYVKSINIVNTGGELCDNFAHDEAIQLQVVLNANNYVPDVLLGIHVYDALDRRIFTSELPVSDLLKDKKSRKISMTIPADTLVPNTYKFNVGLHIPNVQLFEEHKGICPFLIYDNGSLFYKYNNTDYGCVFVKCEWNY